jgi:hypothetical protein
MDLKFQIYDFISLYVLQKIIIDLKYEKPYENIDENIDE